MLRMISWLRPVYPIDSALTDMEGSALLDLRIDPQGRPIQVTMVRSSGAPDLDAAAVRAAHFWRFAPPLSKGRPIEVLAHLELRFHFFTFEYSRLDERLARAVSRSHGHDRRTSATESHEPVIRRLLENLNSGMPERALDSHAAAARNSLIAALQWWGPVTHVGYEGFQGSPEWRTYEIKRESRRDRRDTSVVVRWEIYKVSHETHTSLWKVALDRRGRLWAIKADLVPNAPDERSTSGCVDDRNAG